MNIDNKTCVSAENCPFGTWADDKVTAYKKCTFCNVSLPGCESCVGPTICILCVSTLYLKTDRTGCVSKCSDDPAYPRVWADNVTNINNTKCVLCYESIPYCKLC